MNCVEGGRCARALQMWVTLKTYSVRAKCVCVCAHSVTNVGVGGRNCKQNTCPPASVTLDTVDGMASPASNAFNYTYVMRDRTDADKLPHDVTIRGAATSEQADWMLLRWLSTSLGVSSAWLADPSLVAMPAGAAAPSNPRTLLIDYQRRYVLVQITPFASDESADAAASMASA